MRYSEARLEEFAIEILEAAGADREDAETAARVLVYADLRGIGTHGLSKLPIYVRRIQAGGIAVKEKPVLLEERGCLARIDGRNALGPVVGHFAARKAVELAAKHGLGAAFAGHSNHFGATAYYAQLGLAQGMLGLAMSNANPTMAPWGGRKALIGTNPFAVALPTGGNQPLILDMATSTVARGKIVQAAEEGRELPRGWALDAEGNETTDARAALNGLLTPLGGPKGSGMSLMIDIICGVLTQSNFLDRVGHLYSGLDRGPGIGHAVFMLNLGFLMDQATYHALMDEYCRIVAACPPAAGVERVCLPGELEGRKSEENKRDGVALSEGTLAELNELAGALGVRPLPSRP